MLARGHVHHIEVIVLGVGDLRGVRREHRVVHGLGQFLQNRGLHLGFRPLIGHGLSGPDVVQAEFPRLGNDQIVFVQPADGGRYGICDSSRHSLCKLLYSEIFLLLCTDRCHRKDSGYCQ